MIFKTLGFGLVLCALWVVFKFETAGAHEGFRVFHWPAMVLTGIGPVGLILLCCEWDDIHAVARQLARRSTARLRRNASEDRALRQKLASSYYQMGARAFDGAESSAFSGPMKRALSKLALRISIRDAREMLERDKASFLDRQSEWLQVLSLGVRLTPSIGMLGTILGMVQLLSSLKDPSSIGSPMSLALLTTFFGLFFSLVIWTPLQRKMESLSAQDLRDFDQVLAWLDLLDRRKTFDVLDEPPTSRRENNLSS